MTTRRVRLDLSPLRNSRGFRTLFTGGVITSLGSMVTYVALPFQIAELTGSYVAVGVIGLFELVPLLVFGLYGGSLADRIDRRRMIVAGEIAAGSITIILTVNALMPSPNIIVIYVATMAFASIDGLQRPSLEALLPRLVAYKDLSAAAALNSLRMSSASMVGLPIGGFVVTVWGPATAFGLDAVSFFIALTVFLRLPRVVPASDGDTQIDTGLRHILTGVRYAWSRKDILGTYAIDLAAMTFAFPFALFPFLAADFDAPWALGFLYSAGFVGAATFGLTSGWAPRVRHHGRMIVYAAALWGGAIALVAIAPNIGVVLALLAIAGYFDMMSGHFRLLMWNQSIPDEMRGRMAGIEMLSYSIGPMLGQIRSTTAAQLTGLRASLASGGILCVVAVGLVAASIPALWRYDVTTNVHAQRRRLDESDSA